MYSGVGEGKHKIFGMIFAEVTRKSGRVTKTGGGTTNTTGLRMKIYSVPIVSGSIAIFYLKKWCLTIMQKKFREIILKENT